MRIHWLLAALVLSAILCALHLWAVTDFLYWKYQWFDILMHSLGGLAIGVFLIGVLKERRLQLYISLMVLIFFGWEVFEYVFKIPQQAWSYPLDTAKDIFDDFLGAFVAYVVATKTLWKKT